ncbi:RDD family protein [Guyparkeria sp.]|uniref:RDD family protein n=1 Tax=Guyparkeria sp. TaxID=2035736 RepID=UPI00356242D8
MSHHATPSAEQRQPAETAPLWRRAAALFYDLLFVIALVILATFLALAVTRGEPVPPDGPGQWLYRAWLMAWIAGYFVFFWCRFGQTPGMKVWRLLLLRQPGPCAGPAFLRFLFGVLSLCLAGLPFLLAITDAKRQTWVDRRLDMRVVRLLPTRR